MKAQYTIAISLIAGAALGAAVVERIHAQAKPPAYLVNEVDVINPDVFKEYAPKVGKALQDAGAKTLARAGRVVPLAGEPPKRVVILRFDNLEQAEAWLDSPVQKQLAPMREQATRERGYIVEGIAN